MCEYIIRIKEINDIEIEVIETGQVYNETIVFAHGLGGNCRQWEEQIKYFSSQYHVITFSLQGHGKSSRAVNSYTIKGYSETVLSLLDKMHVKSCIWIGNSMGGVVGYEIMKKRPHLIEHLITNGTAPILDYSKSMLKFIKSMDHILIGLLGFERYIDIAVNASLKDQSKRRKLKKIFMLTDPNAIISSHQILGNYNYLKIIRQSSIRVSFLQAPKDRDINKTIKKYRNELEQMSNVFFYEAKRGGHVLNIEEANDYNVLIEEIIKSSQVLS